MKLHRIILYILHCKILHYYTVYSQRIEKLYIYEVIYLKQAKIN